MIEIVIFAHSFEGLNIFSDLLLKLFGDDCHQNPVALSICMFLTNIRLWWGLGIIFILPWETSCWFGNRVGNHSDAGRCVFLLRSPYRCANERQRSAHHKPETLENISKNANFHVLGLIEEISDGKSCCHFWSLFWIQIVCLHRILWKLFNFFANL